MGAGAHARQADRADDGSVEVCGNPMAETSPEIRRDVETVIDDLDFFPDLSVVEVARLARTMTWKWAATDLFHGGAKAGILGDPKGPRKEAILRAFARALSNEVPEEYVFGSTTATALPG